MKDYFKFNKDSWYSNKYKSALGYSGNTFYKYSSGYSYSWDWGRSKSSLSFKSSGGSGRGHVKEEFTRLEKILKTVYKSVHEIIVILDFAFPIKICFSRETYNHTSGTGDRVIFIPTICIAEKYAKGLDDDYLMDVLRGFGAHEAAHVKYTTIRLLKYFETGNASRADYKLLEILANTFEDIRVEDKLLKERPGYSTYLDIRKKWYFKKYHSCSGKSHPEVDVDKVLTLIKYYRFKDELDEDDMNKLATWGLEDTIKVIDEQLNSMLEKNNSSTKDSCLLALNLIDLLKNNDKINTELPTFSYKNLRLETKATSGIDINSTLDESFSDLVIGDGIPATDLHRIEKLSEGILNRDEKTESVFWEDEKSTDTDKENYVKIKNSIMPLVPALRKILVSQTKNYDFCIHGCRSGLLDTTKLAEAYQDVPQVYKRLGHVSTSNVSIGVLVDESGSMSCYCSGEARYKIARRTAILMNEAFGNIPGVDLYIYGFTADLGSDWSSDIFVYREPGDNFNKYSRLAKIQGRCQNRDGNSILATAERIRKKAVGNCILFVISDGEPCAGDYCGWSAVKDTASKIKKARNKCNMEIIGIGINGYSGFSADLEKLYGPDKFINLTNISTLPQTLGKLVKKTILDNRTTSTTVL